MNATTNKISKLALIIVAIISVLLAILSLSYTYAKYTQTATGTGSLGVAKWSVKIGPDGSATTTSTFTITFEEKNHNSNVASGKIAPGNELYADFEIDPTDTEVAINWEFTLGTITADSGTVPSNLKVSRVCYISGATGTSATEGENITATAGKYQGTMTLGSEGKLTTSVRVRVFIVWDNTVEGNDSTDTSFAQSATTLTIPVTATATQKVS